MTKRKWAVLGIAVVLLAAWTVRVVCLNRAAPRSIIETYEMGETVEYGNDFFNSSRENRNGYKIVVHKASIMPYEEFAQTMQLELPEPDGFRSDYVYDVQVTIINDGNSDEKNGIDMFNTLLVTSNMRLPIDATLWELLYPQLGRSYTFKLRENTQMDFHFPFVVETEFDQWVADLDYLQTTPFYLNISQYPHKKMIKIEV